jgi:hypothetical protein
MKILRTVAVLLLGAVMTGFSTQASQSDQTGHSDQNGQLDQIDRDILIAREAAWRAYFGGDVQTLGDLLPPEFIGISMNEGPFTDRATTLAGARAFKEKGGRLVRLTFPETRAQRFGDTVILYGRYEATIETGGAERTLRGRLTETFVRRNGKWLHPGWHLDLASAPPATSQP